MECSVQIEISAQVKRLAAALVDADLFCGIAESCTGGLIAAACTDLPGSSAWFRGGVVAYANSAKEDLLGVEPRLIMEHGAVSQAVVKAMARGAQRILRAECAMAVSGVAGPDGGTPEKPVGLVWIAIAARESLVARQYQFSGDRASVRLLTVRAALAGLAELLEEKRA